MAEPRVARARRRQARRRRAGKPVAAAPLDRRGRQLLAALLREERHDRVLRAARVGLVRRTRASRSRCARARWNASASCTSRRGRWRRRPSAGVDTPLPMCPFPERALRPLLADTSGLDRLEAAREDVAPSPRAASPPRSTGSTASSRQVTGRAGDARRGRQRRRAHDRLPGLHARPRRHARPGRARGAARVAAAGAGRVALVVRARLRPRRPSCSERVARGRPARSRRCSAR